MLKPELSISVRSLVEYVYRSGDYDATYKGPSRALEGTRAHQKVQKSRPENYTAEVSLKHIHETDKFDLVLQGRIDGIFFNDNNIILEEIKSTFLPSEHITDGNIVHWAQVLLYAYVYCLQNNLDSVDVSLTYYQIDEEKEVTFNKLHTFEQLKEFYYDTINEYLKWAEIIVDNRIRRDISIENLNFPFVFREGQRKLSVYVYKAIQEERNLFLEAPTGTGKTIGTIFPTLKHLRDNQKIFYLAAKTTGKNIALNTLRILSENGLKAKILLLTAKDKVCFLETAQCYPEKCPYTIDFFTKLNGVTKKLLENDVLTTELISQIAEEEKVCPFELALEASLYCDVIICDYNYVFDPVVFLRRFFMDSARRYYFLIDEAHNLVDRARSMYSSDILKSEVMDLKKLMKPVSKTVHNRLQGINKQLLQVRKDIDKAKQASIKDKPESLIKSITKFYKDCEAWLAENQESEYKNDVLEFFFKCNNFLKISEIYGDNYTTLISNTSRELRLELFCIDPARHLAECLKKSISAVFFSATFRPVQYYRDLLGGTEEDWMLYLDSPFPRENTSVLISSYVNTRYTARDSSYSHIAEVIRSAYRSREGNYLVFFPSYEYLQNVLTELEPLPDNFVVQERDMSEDERTDFIARFEQKQKQIGFAVMGGAFGEGIDLTGETLIGAIVVGVGLPQISYKKNIIKEYYNEQDTDGFLYSYLYPGMNRVLQAAGRVIRTMNDKGTIILLDDRFLTMRYRNLFPETWKHYKVFRNIDSFETECTEFWESKKEEEE